MCVNRIRGRARTDTDACAVSDKNVIGADLFTGRAADAAERVGKLLVPVAGSSK
jgi:hypothetical protein